MDPGVRLSVFSANPGGGSKVLWASLLDTAARARNYLPTPAAQTTAAP